jgi:hypothetical protein
MLGEPEPVESQSLGVAGQVAGALERLGGGATLYDGSQVEDGKARNDTSLAGE